MSEERISRSVSNGNGNTKAMVDEALEKSLLSEWDA